MRGGGSERGREWEGVRGRGKKGGSKREGGSGKE